MATTDLSEEQISNLLEVIEKVKNSNRYMNYVAGVQKVSKYAQNLPGEGDAFSKVGIALKKNPNSFKDCAKGQQKLQDTLKAELTQKKLQNLLKNVEINEVIYKELYIKPGSLKEYLGLSVQEDNMSETEKAEIENVATSQEATQESVEKNLYDLPDYSEDFYKSDLFGELGISGKHITQDQKEKLEEAYKKYEQQQSNMSEKDLSNDNGDGSGSKIEEEEKQLTQENSVYSASAEGTETQSSPLKTAMEIEENSEQIEPVNEQDNDWIKIYNEKLTFLGKENHNLWNRETEPAENEEQVIGLKGNFENGTKIHYTAKDKVSVKTPENVSPQADHFKEIVALAKDQAQDIKLGSTMSPAFKMALIEACAKGGVEIQNLNDDDRELYNSFKPKEETREASNSDKKVEYKLNPVIAKGRLTEYSGKIYSADHYSQRAVNAGNEEFDMEISKMEENLNKGWYKATGEDKAKAEILLKKYARAEFKQDEAQMSLYATALQRYGLDSISREPKEKGSFVVKGKAYSERTEEEKLNIEKAMAKAFPEKQEQNSQVLQALKEAKGHTL